MLGTVLDVFRLRQYFNVITRARELVDGVREDAGLLDDARRALDHPALRAARPVDLHPFPPTEALHLSGLKGRRVALVATGGSGALASVVGAARALEEARVAPRGHLAVLGLGAVRLPDRGRHPGRRGRRLHPRAAA